MQDTRKEERSLLKNSDLDIFLEEMKSKVHPVVFPVNHNHTFYFNNDEHEVPFDTSIKGRRYSQFPFRGYLRPSDQWIFELKQDLVINNSRLRKKKRENLSLTDILIRLSKETKFSTPPRVYVADSYQRRHFSFNKINEFRITIDENMTYFFFGEDSNVVEIGKEDYARLEIKVPESQLNSVDHLKVKELLESLGARPVISKKDTAYNLLTCYRRGQACRQVQSSDTEIEAKLILDGDHQQVFHQIKKDFYAGLIEGFNVIDSFPHTLESGKLHQYVTMPGNEFLRISIKGDQSGVTKKEDLEVIKDPFGLDCILKRKETKAPVSQALIHLPSKTIYRKRKYFLVENSATKNSYCILVDRCTHDHNELYQMEVEGLLLSPSMEEEKQVVDDIAQITQQLTVRYPCLRPTSLTKQEWLKRQI